VYAIGFTERTGAHVVDLVRGGLSAYPTLGPVVLQAFFIGLMMLDPIVVVLARRLSTGRRACAASHRPGVSLSGNIFCS
jgi:hypothetical protein